MSLSSGTKILGVIGDPIIHSLSPLIHNLWLGRDGRDAVYVAFRLPALRVVADLQALARFGVIGLNITLPHKQAALEAATSAGPEAKELGVANTLTLQPELTWRADNTDVTGFDAWLATALAGSLASRRVLLIGAGGAARAAAFCLHRAGCRLTIANRTQERAETLCKTLAPGASVCGFDAIAAAMEHCDLAINATSMGHDRDGLAFPRRDGALFMDLSYGVPARRLMEQATAQGWRGEDGLSMLVAQAAVSYRIWFGSDPDREAALALCRERVVAA